MKSLKIEKFKSLSLVALLIASVTLASCSSDDSVSEPKNVLEAGKTYNLSIDATKPSDADTRALKLNEEGSTHKLMATWETSEKVYLCNRGSISFEEDKNFLQPQMGGTETTTLNGSIASSHALSFPIDITLIFPRKEWNYIGQNGTIGNIAATYDYMTAPLELSKLTESGIEASTSVDFSSEQAIVKFILKDKNNNDAAIDATSLRISASGLAQSVDVGHSDNKYTFTNTPGDITVTPASGTSEIFAALRGISGKQVRLTATDGTDTYVYAKDDVTFTHGKYYEITVKMKKITEGIELSAVTSDYIGCVVGQNGKVYSTRDKAEAAYTTAVAMIAYVGSESNCTHGLAIALADESGKMTQSVAETAASETKNKNTPVANGTWRLPTLQDWKYMLIGCGNGATYSTSGTVDATALTSKLATLNASLQTTANYWSSGNSFAPYFVGTTVDLSYTDPYGGSSPCYVRACLTF